jgi:hypothetical protein
VKPLVTRVQVKICLMHFLPRTFQNKEPCYYYHLAGLFRKVQKVQERLELNGTHHIWCNYLNLLGENVHTMKKNIEAVLGQ